MRTLFKSGQWVILIKTGKKYQVEVDYEDWVYLYGLKDPFQPHEIKAA